MSDRSVELCGRGLEQYVARQFDHLTETETLPEDPSQFYISIPIIGGRYIAEQRSELMQRVCRALAAQAFHAKTTPYSWAKKLPLKMDECEMWIRNDCGALQLLGYFGRSMRCNNWDIERHPPFNTFCCGVMEYLFAPSELKMDKGLQKMFPPKALAGLTTPLHWRPPPVWLSAGS